MPSRRKKSTKVRGRKRNKRSSSILTLTKPELRTITKSVSSSRLSKIKPKTKTKTPPKTKTKTKIETKRTKTRQRKRSGKNKDSHKQCKHGRRQMYCVDCYKNPNTRRLATGICEHLARRYRCSICSSRDQTENHYVDKEFKARKQEADMKYESSGTKYIVPSLGTSGIVRNIPVLKIKPIKSRKKIVRPRLYDADYENYIYDMSRREYNPSNQFIDLNFYKNVGKKLGARSIPGLKASIAKAKAKTTEAKCIPHGKPISTCKECQNTQNKILGLINTLNTGDENAKANALEQLKKQSENIDTLLLQNIVSGVSSGVSSVSKKGKSRKVVSSTSRGQTTASSVGFQPTKYKGCIW